ncbi:MAG: chromosomal replication initiator protein DnaA [Rikenellaceae bacterium]
MLQQVTSYKQAWQDCLERIKSQTTEEEFVKWFKPIVPLEYSGNILRLGVPNRTYVNEIEGKYLPFLKPVIAQFFGSQTSLFYAVPKAEKPSVVVSADSDATSIQRFSAQTSTANIKNPFVIPGLKRMNIDPNLNSGYTFANFVEGECNRLSRSAGMAVAVSPGNMNNNPFNPLYIYGDSGLGKTHIVQAIGHEIIQRHPEKQVLYVSMNKFQAQFQTAYKNGEIPDFIHFYQTIDVLIIDDIQELTGKSGTQNAFFNIFNHLHLTGKQIILTSDKSPAELKDIEQRLLTRFKWGFATPVNLPDYETKVKILQSKAKKLHADLSPEVVDYLANNIKANVREIEGALSSLIANASFLQRKVDISLAREVLKIYIKMSHKEITVEGIIDDVCTNMSIPKDRLLSKERKREVVQARQVAMYLAKQHTQAPLASIGLAIGGRNHATVLHACKAVSNMMEMDKNFRHTVEEIERIVTN